MELNVYLELSLNFDLNKARYSYFIHCAGNVPELKFNFKFVISYIGKYAEAATGLFDRARSYPL